MDKKLSHLFQLLKQAALSIAIVILINVFFNVGLQTFYPMPEYNDFCSTETRIKPVEAGGDLAQVEYDLEAQERCSDEYQEARSEYNKLAFIVLNSLGVLILLVGLFWNSAPKVVVTGLTYGGLLSIFIGTTFFWGDMEAYLQFILSGVWLVLLFAVAWKRFRD